MESEKGELSEELSPTIPSTKKPLHGRKRPKSPGATSTASAVMSSALEYLNEKKNKGSDRFDDTEKIFGQHVASSLRSIKDIRTKEYAKLKIQEIIFQCCMGNQCLPDNYYFRNSSVQVTPIDSSHNPNGITQTQATLSSSQHSMYNFNQGFNYPLQNQNDITPPVTPATTSRESPMY